MVRPFPPAEAAALLVVVTVVPKPTVLVEFDVVVFVEPAVEFDFVAVGVDRAEEVLCRMEVEGVRDTGLCVLELGIAEEDGADELVGIELGILDEVGAGEMLGVVLGIVDGSKEIVGLELGIIEGGVDGGDEGL
jgi:hypothetical protein